MHIMKLAYSVSNVTVSFLIMFGELTEQPANVT